MKRVVQHSKLLFKMTVSFTLLGVGLVSVLSYVLYKNYEASAINAMDAANIQMLKQISFSADYMDESAKTYAYSLFVDAKTHPLMYGDGSDLELVFGIKRIAAAMQAVPFVHSVYIYNGKKQQILSTAVRSLSRKDRFFDQEMAALLGRFTNEQRAVPLPRQVPLNEDQHDPRYESVFTYVITHYIDQPGKLDGAVIVNVKADYLNRLVRSMNSRSGKEGYLTLILDRDGKVIHSPGQIGRAQPDWSAEPWIAAVLEPKEDAGSLVGRYRGEDVLVQYASSGSLGWKFVNLVPYQEVMKPIERMKATTLWICLALIVLGSVVSVCVSSNLYSPLGKLIRSVRQTVRPEKEGLDEISLLQSLWKEKSEMLRDNFTLKKNELLTRLLNGEEFGKQQLEGRLRRMIPHFHYGAHYLVCVLRINRYREFALQYSAKDRNLLKFAIGNIAWERTSRSFACEAADAASDHVAVIVQVPGDAPELLMPQMIEIFTDVREHIMKFLGISVTPAVSYTGRNIAEIGRRYQEALNISNYRFHFGKERVLTPVDLRGIRTEGFVPPARLEQHLLDAIMQRTDKAELSRRLASLLQAVMPYSYGTVQSYLFHLLYLLHHRLAALEADGPYQFRIAFGEMFHRIAAAETVKEAQACFEEILFAAADTIQETKSGKSVIIAETIAKIIESNYMDPNLCHEGIASTLNMSKNYIGKLYRKVYGRSIGESITDIRLRKAAELIRNGEHDVEKVMRAIGWENRNYFYRQFKQKFGLSITEFKLKSIRDLPLAAGDAGLIRN